MGSVRYVMRHWTVPHRFGPRAINWRNIETSGPIFDPLPALLAFSGTEGRNMAFRSVHFAPMVASEEQLSAQQKWHFVLLESQ